jgi:DMSO reductase anchor subunit
MHVLAPALVLAGLLLVALEAGRPLRGLRVLTNLRRSWMSRELLAGLLFVLLALNHTVWPSDFLTVVATAAALMLLVSQGLILYCARGIPAWNQRWLPVLFLSSGLLTGAALLLGLVLLTRSGTAGRPLLGGTALGLTLVDLVSWRTYLRQPPTTTALEQSWRCLTRPWPLGSVVWGGHVLPLVLLSAGLYPSSASFFLLLAACVALLLGGLCLKAHVVTRAGYRIELPIPWLAGSPLPSVSAPAQQ